MNHVIISESFDDLGSQHMRFLQEAAKLGKVHVLLWSDDMVRTLKGKTPRFSQEERQYYVQAMRAM